MCAPCSHRDPLGLYFLFLLFLFQQGAHGHLDGMGQRRPIQAVVETYLLGAPGRIVRRSWWPFTPFNSADVHGPPSSCRSELVDLVLALWASLLFEDPQPPLGFTCTLRKW